MRRASTPGHPAFPCPRPAALVGLTVSTLLSGCIYLPRTTHVYDPGCRITTRHMTLEPVQIGAMGGCRNEGCAVLLVGAGATAAASAVISGSIVIVGNVAYWFEKQGQCQPADTPEPPRRLPVEEPGWAGERALPPPIESPRPD